MIVVDASAILEVLLGTLRGARVEARLFERGETLHAPHLLDLEVAQVLRRYAAAREVTRQRSWEALDDLLAVPLTRYPHDVFLPRIWTFRQTVTADDTAYLALAEALDAPLVTCDRHLATVAGHHATVEVV